MLQYNQCTDRHFSIIIYIKVALYPSTFSMVIEHDVVGVLTPNLRVMFVVHVVFSIADLRHCTVFYDDWCTCFAERRLHRREDVINLFSEPVLQLLNDLHQIRVAYWFELLLYRGKNERTT